MTPLERWRQDLIHIRQLGQQALSIDDIFYHRIKRLVRKDATVAWGGKLFEVPYEHTGKTIHLVFDPHAQKAIRIESDTGDDLGAVTLLDTTANLHRKRQRPDMQKTLKDQPRQFNAVEMAYEDYRRSCNIFNNNDQENS
jgi:hypothetical protein